MDTDDDGRAPWPALVAHVAAVDPGTPAAVITIARPGTVAAVSVHARDDPDHWHLVTYGLSAPDPGVAGPAGGADPGGWGFELTLRISRGDDEIPGWAVNLLANLGAHVVAGGHPFAPGHHIDLRGPMRLGSDSAISAAAIALDPELGVLEDAAGGPVELLQVVGLTADELELCRAWRTGAVLDLLRRQDPLLVTRLERTSLLDDPAVREEAQAGVAAEGSALDELRVGTLHWARRGRRRPRVDLSLGAGAATGLGPALRRKLNADGARFELLGGDGDVRFEVADPAGWRIEGSTLVVAVPLARVDELAGLFSGRTGQGRLPGLPDLRFRVVD